MRLLFLKQPKLQYQKFTVIRKNFGFSTTTSPLTSTLTYYNNISEEHYNLGSNMTHVKINASAGLIFSPLGQAWMVRNDPRNDDPSGTIIGVG